MKAEPVLVKVHTFGKVTVPARLRKRLGIKGNSVLEVYTDGDTLIFKVREQ